MTSQIQYRNSQLVDNLRADYQPRHEPNFAWKGQAGLYQGLPALRAYYPLGAHYVTAQSYYATDVANDYDCLAYGSPRFGYDDLIQYAEFNGTNECFYHADNAQFDITGNDYATIPAQRGLTLGAWVYPHSCPTAGLTVWRAIMAKWEAYTLQRSYILNLWPIAGGCSAGFMITQNGSAWIYKYHNVAITLNEWHLVVGRFVPSTSVDVYLDNNKQTLAAGIPATIQNTTYSFTIGIADIAQSYAPFDGYISNAFICASALSDSIIEAIWQQTRAMYRR